MPLIRKIESSSPNMNLQLWKVEEPIEFFNNNIGQLSGEAEQEYALIHHPKRKLEWLSSRWLLMNILQEYNVPIDRLHKDSNGKPYLQDCDLHLSISHAYPYVAAIVDTREPTGVDIEAPKQKITRVAPKFLHPDELEVANGDIFKLSLYWCAKEALYKIFGRKKVQFSRHLLIDPFEYNGDTVDLTGKISLDDRQLLEFGLHGHIQDDLVMVHKK